MLRMLAITAVMIGAQAAAHADVYRWVDAKGQVQYSDRWVPGSELIKVDKGRQSPEVVTARQATERNKIATSNERIAAQQAQASTEQAVQQDVAKVREEQCKQAKERYEKAIQARRIYRPAKDGEREYISDAEADAYRVQLRSEMQAVCGG